MATRSCKHYWLGIDVAQESVVAAVTEVGLPPSSWKQTPTVSFVVEARGLKSLLAWTHQRLGARGVLDGICLESTGKLSRRLADRLAGLDKSLPTASIINPKRSRDFAKSLGIRDKSDEIEAAVLAHYGATNKPATTPARGKAYQRLRDLFRTRESVLTARDALANSCRDQDDDFAFRSLRKTVEALDEQVKNLAKEAKKVIDSDAQLRRDFQLLDSIKGIGFLTAWALLAELGDLRQYGRNGLVAYAGMYPRIWKSGKSVDALPHLVKGGGALVRKALYNAARSIFRSKNNTLRAYADRLSADGKTSMDCLMALMRKLLLIARAVLIQGKPYDPKYGIGK